MTREEIEHEANKLSVEDLEELRDFCDTLLNALYAEQDASDD
jgi:hypothetical protein